MLDSQSENDKDSTGWDGIDRRKEKRPESGEAPFNLDEVFFSRTDGRGVIQCANYVFRRVAHMEWNDVIGAPHKIIRHPDMPKGVFHLFWKMLGQGKAVGAYVKNRSSDGLHYWVFASVVPWQGGFLSARIRPSSEMFETIKEEYAKLLEAEKTQDLTPEESSNLLMARLQELGFPTYEDFEAHAFSEELLSRNAGLEQPANQSIVDFKHMLSLAEQLKVATETLVHEFEAVQIIPSNMRIMSSRIEPTGGPFNTLSATYGSMSAEISDWFEKNVAGEDSNFAAIKDSVNLSMFLEGTVGILKECDQQLGSEKRSLGKIDIEVERKNLTDLVDIYSNQSNDSLKVLENESRRIQAACKTMNRHILGLSTARVLCKIESARMGVDGEAMADIISRLGRFQDSIGEQLGRIEKLSEEIEKLSAQ